MEQGQDSSLPRQQLPLPPTAECFYDHVKAARVPLHLFTQLLWQKTGSSSARVPEAMGTEMAWSCGLYHIHPLPYET